MNIFLDLDDSTKQNILNRNKKEITHRIKETLAEEGLTQQMLASELNYSRKHINNLIQDGGHTPEHLQEIADVLGVDLLYLLGEVDTLKVRADSESDNLNISRLLYLSHLGIKLDRKNNVVYGTYKISYDQFQKAFDRIDRVTKALLDDAFRQEE